MVLIMVYISHQVLQFVESASQIFRDSMSSTAGPCPHCSANETKREPSSSPSSSNDNIRFGNHFQIKLKQLTPIYRSPIYLSPIYRSPIYRSPIYRPPIYFAPIYRGFFLACSLIPMKSLKYFMAVYRSSVIKSANVVLIN